MVNQEEKTRRSECWCYGLPNACSEESWRNVMPYETPGVAFLYDIPGANGRCKGHLP